MVERDGGTGYGSGLRLATSLVVTAGHVVEGSGSVRVRLSGGGPEEIIVTGRTMWRGARMDVALVELASDVHLDEVTPIAIGVVPDEADGRLPFTAIGFPRHQSWTDTDTATWRDSDQAGSGNSRPVPAACPHPSSSATSPWPRSDWWCGSSTSSPTRPLSRGPRSACCCRSRYWVS
ncbi:trypsin-like peptidase domain-containing protein [Streptomyces sp. NPDC101149]|uniref:trypsin-like peptidase domain-containing protein n=1 Tax=Streptomyces sp. NPDC101149 TaxID=3366113 RepID=UPI003827581B